MRRALLLLALPAVVSAQRDTTALTTVVITAERTRSTLGNATAGVTRIEGAALARLPHATVADLLRLAPGFSVVSFDGLGYDPQLMVRGFYGGGEAEYVVVMVDGKAQDQLHTGLVPWEGLPPISAIEAIEVVRGGSSALYGSTAIGAVINVITRKSATPRWGASGGSFGTWRLDGSLGAFSAGVDRTDGFRDHANRTAARARMGVRLTDGVELVASSHWRDFDEPGPLLESLMRADREASDSLFRFDHTRDRVHTLSVDGTRGRVRASLTGEIRRTDATRTLVLAPGFGDTKDRVVNNARAAGTLQVELSPLTVGLDASHGTIDSRYYQTQDGNRGALDASGDGRRTTVALFAQYVAQATDAVRFSLGSRLDWLDDSFEDAGASHTAFSPKVGVNVRLAADLHGYVTASRSFKAPTLDQLFDQRSIPIPFPPFSISTSNRALEPQFGTSVEGGLYSAMGRLTSSLSVYQMDMKNELDFDVQSFRYVNIGRSRHRGIELGVRAWGLGVSPFLNYGAQLAESRSGEHAGKQLKAIPRHTVTGGVTVGPGSTWQVGLTATRLMRMYLDDANTRRIPDYSRVDGQFTVGITAGVRLTLEATNLFDATYSATGFPDPAGSDEGFFYPAAGRALRLGIRHGW